MCICMKNISYTPQLHKKEDKPKTGKLLRREIDLEVFQVGRREISHGLNLPHLLGCFSSLHCPSLGWASGPILISCAPVTPFPHISGHAPAQTLPDLDISPKFQAMKCFQGAISRVESSPQVTVGYYRFLL